MARKKTADPTGRRDESITFARDADGDTWRLLLWWDTSAGRAEVTGLAIIGCDDRPDKPVTTAVVRSLNLGSVIGESRAGWADALASLAAEETERWRETAEAMASPPRRGGLPPTPLDELADVARVYRQADAIGMPTTIAVAQEFGLSRSGASKRIRRARERGLLPPTQRREE